MSNVMITGGATPFSVALVRALLADPTTDHVLVLALHHDTVPCSRGRLTCIDVDPRHERDVRSAFFGVAADAGIDTVVHAPAHPFREVEHKPGENLELLRLFLHLAERTPGMRRFILVGTSAVYRVDATQPAMIGEGHPLAGEWDAPAWVRRRVDEDVTACARVGMSDLEVQVLRLSEVFAADLGGQLWDYVQSRICFRPLGFDPMLNLLSLDDAVRATRRAIAGHATGPINIPGADTLPLSRLIALSGCADVPMPGPWLHPLYRMRARVLGTEFHYPLNERRFHLSAVLDGRRASRLLGYEPACPIVWPTRAAPPRPWRPSRPTVS